jgi:fluoride exporter
VTTVLSIAFAGSLGALARYGLEGAVSRHSPGAFPWGTFVVNVTGSFLLGLLFTLMTDRLTVDPWFRSAVTIGFLGAYTTFSTFAQETHDLFSEGHAALGIADAAGSIVVGVLAVVAGIAVGKAI